MKVLLPTKNKNKIEKWGGLIRNLGYELITLNDLDISFDEVKENGETTLENALIKAEYYYKKTGIVTVTTDSSLYIDGLSKEEQVGLFAGRKVIRDERGNIVSEEKLTDDENYQRLKVIVEKLGGETKGYFEESIVIYYGTNAYENKNFIMNRLFKSPGSSVRKKDAPMRSFTYYPDLNKYRSEMTSEEANLSEGLVFKEQHDFFKESLNKVKHITDYNFNILLDRITDSTESLSRSELNSTLGSIKQSCLSIGNGGSYAASLFASLVLENKNNLIAVNIQPRDILYRDISKFKNILAVTYGNNNHGINCALKRGQKYGLNTYVLTNNPRVNGLDNMIVYNPSLPKEYSYISLASTFIPMAIMLKYYLNIDNNQLNDLIKQIYYNSKELSEDFLTNCDREKDVIEIMTGDNTYVAASILNSTIKEAGLGIPVIHEKYNYCHGDSTLSYYHPGNTLIYLINGAKTDLDEILLANIIKQYQSVIILKSSEEDKIIGEFDLAMQSIYLCKSIAEAKGMGLSKVDYSPVVKRLYPFNGGM